MLMQISVKMYAVMLIVGDTSMLVRLNGTLISLRSSGQERGRFTDERTALILFSSVFRVPGRATQLKASLCLQSISNCSY